MHSRNNRIYTMFNSMHTMLYLHFAYTASSLSAVHV